MRCPFCQALNSRNTRACHFCGGPLSGLNPLLAPPLQPESDAQSVVSPPPLPPTLIQEVRPAKPVLVAQKAREKGAPRIVAALFWQRENSFHPLFVLEQGELQLWEWPRDEWHLFPSRRTLRGPVLTLCAAFAPECEVVATGLETGQLRLQRLEPRDAPDSAWKCHALGSIEAHRGPVLALAIAKTRCYSAGSDGAVVLTNLPAAPHDEGFGDAGSLVVLDGIGALSCLCVSPDGRWLALGADDGRVQMWRLSEDGTQARLDWTAGKDLSPVKSVRFSPNGNMLLSRDAQGDLVLWAAQTGHRLQCVAQSNPLISPALAPDSRLLAHADTLSGIALLDAWTGTARHNLPSTPGEVQALAFSPASPTPARETLLILGGSAQIAAWKVNF